MVHDRERGIALNGRLERDIKLNKKILEKLSVLPDFVSDWYMSLSASELSETSCLDYVNKLSRFLEFIDKNTNEIVLSEITQGDVNRYMTSIRKKRINGDIKYTSDSYRQCIWSCLNNFFSFAVRSGLIRSNFMEYIKRPKNNDLERINKNRIRLQEDNYTDILENIRHGVGSKKAKSFQKTMVNRDMSIILLLMTTGMRKSALLQTNIDDLDLKNKKLLVTDKGNKTIVYYLGDETIKSLSKWMINRAAIINTEDQDPLFVSANGTRLSNSALDKLVDKYCKDVVGRHVSPHKFRSGFCSNVYNNSGGNIEVTRRAAGHANVSTTQRYIVISKNEMQEASNIMNNIVQNKKKKEMAS